MLVPLLLAAAAAHTSALPPSRTAGKAVTACLAVTRSDVQLALGRAVGKPEAQGSATSATCDYATGRGRVTITLQHLDRDPDIATEITVLEREIEGARARPAPGFGPQAFFLDIANAGVQLHVIRGRDYLMVSALGFGEAPQVSPAVAQMARAAMARW